MTRAAAEDGAITGECGTDRQGSGAEQPEPARLPLPPPAARRRRIAASALRAQPVFPAPAAPKPGCTLTARRAGHPSALKQLLPELLADKLYFKT